MVREQGFTAHGRGFFIAFVVELALYVLIGAGCIAAGADPVHVVHGALAVFFTLRLLLVLTVVSSLLLVTEFPLIAFKFKTKGLAANWPKFLFLGISVLLLAVLQYRAGPPILVLYFVFSMIDATKK